MHTLAGLLLRERYRKLNQHYGWIGYASAGLMLILLGCGIAAYAEAWMQRASHAQIQSLMLMLWISWTMAAVVLGKDLHWHIRLERLLRFPFPGFLRLYAAAFALGYLSVPILAGAAAMLCATAFRQGLHPARLAAALSGFLLFAASIRCTASLARNGILRRRSLSPWHSALAGGILLFLLLVPAAAVLYPAMAAMHPAILLGRLISGSGGIAPLAGMVLGTGVLAAADFELQRARVYSGARSPLAPDGTHGPGPWLWLHPSWPAPQLRLGLLGWMRCQSALLLFLWGSLYSFLWTFFSKPNDAEHFYLFIFMNLLFHSHIRGNLLGIDRGGAWLYYSLPDPPERSLSLKSHSLTLLQCGMIASLLAAGLLRARLPGDMLLWIGFLSYAVSGILWGELWGFFASLRFPESIDRTSQFDGSSSIGTLIVGAAHLSFLIFFLHASAYVGHHGTPLGFWGYALGLPLMLGALRQLALQRWIAGILSNKSEFILKKLLWD